MGLSWRDLTQPIRITQQTTLLPELKGPFSAGHPRYYHERAWVIPPLLYSDEGLCHSLRLGRALRLGRHQASLGEEHTRCAWKPTKWYVVDRKPGKGVVAKHESDPFFCFHTINAWEESSSDPSQPDIVIDLSAYENIDILILRKY